MRETMTLREAAPVLSVTSSNSVRRILSLHTIEGRKRAHAGYDALGRQLIRRDAVLEAVRKRNGRGNWRVASLGAWAEPRTGQEEHPPVAD